jgi:hypothetical protein
LFCFAYGYLYSTIPVLYGIIHVQYLYCTGTVLYTYDTVQYRIKYYINTVLWSYYIIPSELIADRARIILRTE